MSSTYSLSTLSSSTRPFLFLRAKILRGFSLLGVAHGDSDRVRGQKFMLKGMAAVMSVGGILWGVLLVGFGLYNQSLIPFGYVVLSVINLSIFGYTKHFKSAGQFQVILSLLLPVLLQGWLGGFVASGVVMLWSPMALLGALILQKGRGMMVWILLFIGATVISGVFDAQFQTLRPEILTPETSLVLLIINLICMVGLITALSINNVAGDRKTRHKLYATMDELEQSKEEIATQSETLQEKSDALELQNHKMMESLRYAQRIQQAILPERKDLCEIFQDTFLVFKPRDVVSGDFYWCSELPDHFVVVAADCTGHGVSGAFLTMLGSSILNQIVNEAAETDPGTIMQLLDKRLSEYLNQGRGNSHRVADGMDVAICVFHKGSQTVKFAGAKQSMMIVREGELFEVKGDKFPVGDNTQYKEKAWETLDFDYQTNDMLYLASDGYKDQFGGKDNMKFLSKNFKKLLTELAHQPLAQQYETLETQFKAWKGESQQTDDVLVMGMRL